MIKYQLHLFFPVHEYHEGTSRLRLKNYCKIEKYCSLGNHLPEKCNYTISSGLPNRNIYPSPKLEANTGSIHLYTQLKGINGVLLKDLASLTFLVKLVTFILRNCYLPFCLLFSK